MTALRDKQIHFHTNTQLNNDGQLLLLLLLLLAAAAAGGEYKGGVDSLLETVV